MSTGMQISGVDAGVRVWVNGQLSGPEGTLSVLDHGLTVGDGVFETAKVVDGQVFALSRHHERMDRSLAGLGLEPLDRGRLQAGIDAVLGQGPMEFGRLRYTVTAGPGPLGSDRSSGAATYIVTALAQDRPGPTSSVIVVPWVRNERSALAGLKTTSYAENVVALSAAKQAGATEAILANSAGELCEGTSTNVFVVRDGVVLTAPLEAGPLAGITRALAIEWLTEAGIPVVQQRLPLSVLDEADEVWLTSSLRDISAVTNLAVLGAAQTPGGLALPAPAVTPRVLGDGPGPVARRAQQIFAERVAAQIDP